MSTNKQALREAAEKATRERWAHLNGIVYAHTEETEWELFEGKAYRNEDAAFIAAANPATVLALLDELEAKDKYAKDRDAENEDLMLTVGRLRVEKEAAEKTSEARRKAILRTHKMFQKQRDRAATAEKRIAELEGLEAEPVGEVSEQRDGLILDGTVDLGGTTTHRIIKGASKMKRLPLGTKFYTAPQPLTTSERAELENYRNAQQVVPEWTNEQCLEFLSIAFRHAEIKGDLEMDDIRLGVKMVNSCRAAMQSGAVKGGWVMVPAKPTPEMLRAIMEANQNQRGSLATYSRLLAAAPQQEV